MTHYAIVIELEGKIAHFVINQKKQIEKQFPHQPYCSSKPHITLYYGALNPLFIPNLKTFIESKTKPFYAKTNNMIVFENDITTGGHTLAIKIVPTQQLYCLQEYIANTLIPFIQKDTHNTKYPLIDPYKTSYTQYGFPFIGKHWIPHITIASLTNPIAKKKVSALRKTKINTTFSINLFSIWEVNNHIESPILSIRI